jgi:AraC family transcriptional regulator
MAWGRFRSAVVSDCKFCRCRVSFHQILDEDGYLRTYADWYIKSDYSPYLRQHRSAGGNRPVAMLRVKQPAGVYADPATSDYVLIRIFGQPYRSLHDTGLGAFSCVPRDGDLLLKPSNNSSRCEVFANHSVQFLTIPEVIVSEVHNEIGASGAFDSLYTGLFRDPLTRNLCDYLWQEISRETSSVRTTVDSAVLTIVGALLSKAGTKKTNLIRNKRFSIQQMKKLRDFVLDNMDEDVSLAAMASVICMPVMQFSKSFKKSAGLPPHQYVIRLRIERAIELLQNTSQSLVEIAFNCGFSSQSHFTSVFSNRFGVTPGQYRNGSPRGT